MTDTVTDTVETYRGSVHPWEMDHVGHLAMEAHARRFDEATRHFLAHLGVTPPYLREEWREVVVREQRATWLEPVSTGALLVIRSRLLDVREKVLRVQHALWCRHDGAGERQVATMELVVAHVDAIRRRSREWPSDVLMRGAQLLRATPVGAVTSAA